MRMKSQEKNAMPLTVDARLRETLRDVLVLRDDMVAGFEAHTPLFGAIPELDSMAVATLLTEIEDRFAIVIDDDDVDGETFETFGTLAAFVDSKVAARR